MDSEGTGRSYTFRMKVTTKADGDSAYSEFSHQTLDVVAPVLTSAKVSAGSCATRAGLYGVVRNSARTSATAVAAGTTVMVDRLDAGGNALSSAVASSGPIAVSPADGTWSMDVPFGCTGRFKGAYHGRIRPAMPRKV